VIGTMNDKIANYEKEDENTTVADIIANELTNLLGEGGMDILHSDVNITYYEHIHGMAVEKAYSPDLDIKSLMWTIPLGKSNLQGSPCLYTHMALSIAQLMHTKLEPSLNDRPSI
jgi:hypothetical protein